jgi:hypothetical protein
LSSEPSNRSGFLDDPTHSCPCKCQQINNLKSLLLPAKSIRHNTKHITQSSIPYSTLGSVNQQHSPSSECICPTPVHDRAADVIGSRHRPPTFPEHLNHSPRREHLTGCQSPRTESATSVTPLFNVCSLLPTSASPGSCPSSSTGRSSHTLFSWRYSYSSQQASLPCSYSRTNRLPGFGFTTAQCRTSIRVRRAGPTDCRTISGLGTGRVLRRQIVCLSRVAPVSSSSLPWGASYSPLVSFSGIS